MFCFSMRILVVTDAFPPGCDGSGWSTYYLCRALRSEGHDVLIAKRGKNGSYEFEGFTVHMFGGFRELDFLSLRNGVKKLVSSFRPDVVHAQHFVSCRAVADVVGVKKICTIRDYWPTFYDGSCFNIRSKKNYGRLGYFSTLHSIFWKNSFLIKLASPIVALYMWLRTLHGRLCLQKMDKVVCVSKFVSDKTPAKNKVVVNNMIDIEANSKYVKRKFSGNIVFAGKFNEMKGALLVAKIVGSLPRELYNQVYFLGNGPLLDKMKSVCKGEYLGHSSNDVVLEKMANSLVILPAYWDEPLGRTILEALSVGAAIVTTPTGGTPEIIEDGKDGSLCSPDFDTFRSEVINVLKYDKNVYMENALKKAKKFDWKKVIKEYNEIYG